MRRGKSCGCHSSTMAESWHHHSFWQPFPLFGLIYASFHDPRDSFFIGGFAAVVFVSVFFQAGGIGGGAAGGGEVFLGGGDGIAALVGCDFFSSRSVGLTNRCRTTLAAIFQTRSASIFS